MRNFFLIIVVLFFSNSAFSHPGIGIVKDSKGDIYYTDLSHVWKLNNDGSKKIAVRNVHTHELFIDKEDNLYGEHLWYNGEKLNTWGHYTWRLDKTGKLDTLIKPKEGLPDQYSFTRDSVGNMYWVDRWKVSRFKKKSPSGEIITIAEGEFKNIRWMHATKKGTLYFVDLYNLYRIQPCHSPELIAEGMNSTTVSFSPYSGKHSIMGIWTDEFENIYVANFSGQVIKKIDSTGMQTIVTTSSSPWSPTGGVFDNQGNLWILEYSLTNQARIRKVSKADLGVVPGMKKIIHNDILPVLMIGAVVCMTGFLVVFSFRMVEKGDG